MRGAMDRYLQPLVRRLRELVGRALLHRVNPAQGHQRLQLEVLAGDVRDDVEHFEPYGFTSNPLPGAEPATVQVAGARSHTIALVVADRRHRKRGLASGEVAIYTDEGDYLLFRRGRIVEVVAGTQVNVTAPEVQVHASTRVLLDTPLVRCTGNVEAVGHITDKVGSGGQSMDGMRQVYDTHNHPENDNGGPTDSPNQKMGTD